MIWIFIPAQVTNKIEPWPVVDQYPKSGGNTQAHSIVICMESLTFPVKAYYPSRGV